MMRVLSSLPLSTSRPLSSDRRCHGEFGSAYQDYEKWIDMGLETDRWGAGEGASRAHRSAAPRGCVVWVYGWGNIRQCVCSLCESAVSGNEGMGKWREMRWVGHVGPRYPPLSRASSSSSSRCHAALRRERMRQPGGWSEKPSKGHWRTLFNSLKKKRAKVENIKGCSEDKGVTRPRKTTKRVKILIDA